MDPFTIPAEIATILAAAQAAPSATHRRASRKKRQQAYLAFQHECIRLMACANHLSTLGQIRIISWRTMVAAAMPMLGGFAGYVASEKPIENPILKQVAEILETASTLTKAGITSSTVSFAAVQAADVLYRDRIIQEMRTVHEIAAEFLASLSHVRLLGKPRPIAAAETLLGVIHELFDRIPTERELNIYVPILRKQRNEQVKASRGRFDDCLTAFGAANKQFEAAVQADGVERNYRWQLWRPTRRTCRSAAELLSDAEDHSESGADANEG